MTITPITTALSYTEPFLWAAALLAFLRYRNRVPVPAFGVFLAIRTAGAFLLLGISHAPQFFSGIDLQLQQTMRFDVYWTTYLGGCVALFFVLQRIFLHIMAPFPSLSRLGLIVFRWAAVTSVIVSAGSVAGDFATIPLQTHLAAIAAGINCGISVLVLCLLAFLVVCMRTLRQPFRSWTFGICLGLGIMAATELTESALGTSALHVGLSPVSGILMAAALLVWIGYLVVPEHKKKQSVALASSTLLQWNDLAQEIGPNTQPQVVVPQSGFLQNVESVVDRVLAKNSLGNAS